VAVVAAELAPGAAVSVTEPVESAGPGLVPAAGVSARAEWEVPESALEVAASASESAASVLVLEQPPNSANRRRRTRPARRRLRPKSKG